MPAFIIDTLELIAQLQLVQVPAHKGGSRYPKPPSQAVSCCPVHEFPRNHGRIRTLILLLLG